MDKKRTGWPKRQAWWWLLPSLVLLLGLLLPVSSMGRGVRSALLDVGLTRPDGTERGSGRLAAGAQPGGRLLAEAPQGGEAGTLPVGNPLPGVRPAEALGQQTFYALADTYVLEGYPGVNVGDAVDMWAGYDDYLDPDGEIVRSLVQFDISSLPSGETITKAMLRLFLVSSYDYPNTPRTITTHRATDAWAEMEVTWSSQPGMGEAYGSASILSEAWGWHEFDVTDLVATWQQGTQANHGIVIRGPEGAGLDSGWRAFGTREEPEPPAEPHPPELVVEYGVASNTPPSISGLPDQELPVDSSRPQAIDLWVHAHDAESADSELTYTIDNTPDPNAGVSISGNRYVDIFPVQGWEGQTDVRIKVTDPGGLSDTDVFRVTVSSTSGANRVFLPLATRNWCPGLLAFDDFSDPNSGWYVGENAYSKWTYLDGEYQILVTEPYQGTGVTPDYVLPGNYRVAVDARQVTSNPSSYGLMFDLRVSGGSSELHQLLVDPGDQQYLLERRNLDGSWSVLIDWTYSPAIRTGTATNHLAVERIGTTLYFYVNGTLVTTYQDASYASPGRDAGVRAYSYSRAPVDVRFDNFAVCAR